MAAAGATAAPKVYEPRDAGALGRFVIVLLYIDIVVVLASLAAAGIELSVIQGLPPDATPDADGSVPLPTAALLFRGFAGLALLLIHLLLVGFFVLKWIYRVDRNAHALARGLTITPPWAVGWYFVPFASLIKPYQAMKEVWQVSANPTAWASEPTPGLLRWWWGLWLAGGILGNLSFRLSFRAHEMAMVTLSDYAEIASGVLGVGCDLIFIAIVRRICDMQTNALSGRVFA